MLFITKREIEDILFKVFPKDWAASFLTDSLGDENDLEFHHLEFYFYMKL